MKGTLLVINPSAVNDEGGARSRTLLAALCALLIAALLIGGYLFLRKRHAQQTLLAIKEEQGPPVEPKGPPKAQILMDEAVLKGDQTLVAGTVRNISNEQLASLTIDLELIRRKGSTTDKTSIQVQPSQLAPQEEGRYSLPLRSADYISVKLVALRSGANATALVYTSAPGQKRPVEKTESKTIVVKRPSTGKDGFLNTPDTPGRVP